MKLTSFILAPFIFASMPLTVLATAPPPPARSLQAECDALIRTKGKASDTQRLHRLFDLTWEYTMREYPEWATSVGHPGYDDRWTDLSEAALARRKTELQEPLRVLKSIDRAKLGPADRLNYDLFKRQAEEAVAESRFPSDFLQISPMGGIHQELARVLADMPAEREIDFKNRLARLERAPEYIRQTRALLARGLAAGVTPAQVSMAGVPAQVDAMLVTDPAKHPLLSSFKKMPASISAPRQAEFRAEAEKRVVEEIIPAFRELRDFLVNDYLPGCRANIAFSSLPDGEAWYAQRVRTFTTTSRSAQEIHALGEREVKRIRAEMEVVMKETGWTGTFAAFLEDLRTNPKHFYKTRAELLTGYRDIAKRADPALARLFGKLPRLPYGVIPVPDYSEKGQTTAYYQGGSAAAGRPGYFYANLYAVETRPKWEMEPLTLHEAMPGHHLQIALAQEQGELPKFRQEGGYTAFIEGWGLYSETLGYEMGMYQDPYNHFGALTYQMWLAVRLVVDTGMHNFGWTRQQSIDFFKANSPKPEHDITVEIDRYILWPGQALAYMIGKMKIDELRGRAKAGLGDAFDIRKFHDALLENGALPLDVLETRMDEWLAAQKKKSEKK